MLLEGIAIAAYAIKANTAYIYIRGEFVRWARILEEAIAEARASEATSARTSSGSGYDLDIWVHRGAGAYICGEETALIESLEGKRGFPRLKPPFPAVVGRLRQADGGQQRRDARLRAAHHRRAAPRGSPRSAGRATPAPKLYCVSGHVARPGVYELPIGVTFREIIEKHCGGMRKGQQAEGVLPRRLVGADHDRRRDRRPRRLRRLCRGRHDARLGRGDRPRPVGRHRRGGRQPRALLRPRVVRPVHPLPRGLRLGDGHPRPDRRRPRPPRRSGRRCCASAASPRRG